MTARSSALGAFRRPLLPGLALALLAANLPAQTEPRLVAAVQLARDGQGDSARAAAGRILSSTRPTDPIYPEVLYTVAVVASSTQDKRLYLQRVAVEYSQSEWADDALLQLAQLDYAAADAAGTVAQVRRLLADYPLSPLRPMAALWGARAAFDVRENPLGCQWADLGVNEAGDQIELRNQLEFQRERCRALMAADTGRAGAPATRPATPPAGPQWLVQVAALRTREAADRAIAELNRMKYQAFTFREDGLWKVRAGPFPSREAAEAAVEPIRRRLSGRPYVTRAPLP
ncbi:MAG TPA: SPOR domain-containing protein [Gemmatimonadales bacterium]|nr:SPOR domain-containing protein [Gemmatimonadales bacterium]